MNKDVLGMINKEYGTPLYVFDLDLFKNRAEQIKAIVGIKTGLCYSIKANPFLLFELPDGFSKVEVCSPGELLICKKTGIDMKKVILYI